MRGQDERGSYRMCAWQLRVGQDRAVAAQKSGVSLLRSRGDVRRTDAAEPQHAGEHEGDDRARCGARSC